MKHIALLITAMVLSACGGSSTNQKSNSGAAQARVEAIQKDGNGRTSEQRNIQDRITVTTRIGKIMWLHLINEAGVITRRFPIRNKMTSSGKRLEPTSTVGKSANVDTYPAYPTFDGWNVTDLIQPDGTYGDSGTYQFWFDPMNRYHQIGGVGMATYLLTDYPIDIENQLDKITGMYNAHQAAAAWAEEQEKSIPK